MLLRLCLLVFLFSSFVRSNFSCRLFADIIYSWFPNIYTMRVYINTLRIRRNGSVNRGYLCFSRWNLYDDHGHPINRWLMAFTNKWLKNESTSSSSWILLHLLEMPLSTRVCVHMCVCVAFSHKNSFTRNMFLSQSCDMEILFWHFDMEYLATVYFLFFIFEKKKYFQTKNVVINIMTILQII